MGKGPFSWGQWSNTSWSIISKCDGNRHKAGNTFSPWQLVPVKSVTRRIWDTNTHKYQWVSTSAKRPSEPTHHQIQGHPRWKSHGMNRMGSTVNRVVPFLPGRSKPKTMVCCRCMWNLALKRLAESFILYSFPTWHGDTVVSRTQKDPKNPQPLTILDIPVLCWKILRKWPSRTLIAPASQLQIRDAARVDMHLLAVAGRNILGKSHPEYANLAQVAAVGVVSGTWTWYWSLVFLEGVETFQTWNLSKLSFCYKMRLWFAWTNFPKSPPPPFFRSVMPQSRKTPQHGKPQVAWCDDYRQVTQLTLNLVAHASPASAVFWKKTFCERNLLISKWLKGSGFRVPSHWCHKGQAQNPAKW